MKNNLNKIKKIAKGKTQLEVKEIKI